MYLAELGCSNLLWLRIVAISLQIYYKNRISSYSKHECSLILGWLVLQRKLSDFFFFLTSRITNTEHEIVYGVREGSLRFDR